MEDLFGYRGKVCVVTGSASGIGKAVTELLVNLGAVVYAVDVVDTKVAGVKESIRCDLSIPDEIDRAFEIIPKNLNSFFGIAGTSGLNTTYETTFNINFSANKYITEKYVRWRMREGGTILYVSSTAGLNYLKYKSEQDPFVNAKSWDEIQKLLVPLAKKSPSTFAYMFSKRCLSEYASIKSIEYGKVGIRMNTVLPASTKSGMQNEFEEMAGGYEALLDETGVAGRLAEAKEIAYPCVFLNSKMASFIAGESLCVDYADHNLKELGMKKDREDISATNNFVLFMAKREMAKNAPKE